MTRFFRAIMLTVVFVSVLIVGAAGAAPPDTPFPLRINLPVGPPVFAAEGIAMVGKTFWLPNSSGGVIKGDVETGVLTPLPPGEFIPTSPATPSLSHRTALGDTVDSHNRLWVAGNLGSTVAGPPASVPKRSLFVYDATTGAPLAVYKVTDATAGTMNDMVVIDTGPNPQVWVSDTTAPNGAGTEVQHVMLLGPGGSLPPGGEIDPVTLIPLDQNAGPDFTDVPTPGFISSDGVDVLPNGKIAMTSVSGNDGRIIVIDPDTFKVTNVAVTTPNEPWRPASLPPLLSGDGVVMDGNVMYYPENRAIAAACPAPNANLICQGSVAIVVFDPATDYTTAKVVARLGTPAGLGPLRSPPNLERFGSRLYPMSSDPTGGRYLVQVDSNPPHVMSLLTSQVEAGPAFSGPVATVIDPAAATTAGLSATIDWGDSTPSSTGTVTGSGGVFTVSGTHNYVIPAVTPNTANPSVTVTFVDGPNGTTRSNVRAGVLSAAPIDATAPAMAGAANVSLPWVSTFTDSGVAGAITKYTASIVWGDGTANTTCSSVTATCLITGTGPYTVTTTHTFTRPGVYAPRITVTDGVAPGGTGAMSGTATIIGPPEAPLAVTGVARTGFEGTPIGNTAVATFTDPNVYASGPRPVAQYTAPISWGDGTPNTNGTIAFNTTTNVFTVSGNHIYAKDGTYTVTVTPVSLAGTTGTASATATIADADLIPLPVQPAPPAQAVASPPLKSATGTTLSGVEGASISGVAANFSDPRNAYGDASHFTATVDWGDGTAASAGDITQLSYTRYTAAGSHTYAEEGTYTATVTINDAGGNPVSATSTVTVADAALSSTGTTLSGVAASSTSGVVANFSDADPGGTVSDYTATIDWGDGSAVGAGTIGPGFTVSGSHTYAKEGTYTVKVVINDVGGSTTTATSTVKVGDAALRASGTTLTGVEGASLSGVVATFTDDDPAGAVADFSATIDWGDGSSSAGTIGAGATGGFTVSGSHTYAEEGNYSVTVLISDTGGAAASALSSIRVADAPLTASGTTLAGVEGASVSGVVANFTDADPAGTVSDFSAMIEWGDGTSSAGTIGAGPGGFTVSGSHVYAEEGSYGVKVAIADVGGSTAAASSSVRVVDAALAAGTLTLGPAVEGTGSTSASFAFSDANPGATAADFTASIAWGDGSTTAGVVSAAGTGFVVSGSHAYADEGSYAVTVSVLDEGGSTVTKGGSAKVDDAPLTAGLLRASCGSGPCAVTFGFTDANPGATVADFTATINWGDGTSSAGVVSVTAGGFVVSGSHVYADDGGGHAIKVTVLDDGGSTVSSTGPAATAMLLAKRSGGEDDGESSSSFTVVATCSPGSTATALLNGVAVKNGDVVRLKLIKKGEQKVKRDDGRLTISATSFQLVVTCTDAAGNKGSAATSPVFKKHGHDEDRDEFRNHHDDERDHQNQGGNGGDGRGNH